MIKKRIIPCLDVKDGTVVKGIQFKGLREIGDPVELAKRYNALGADELVFLDISATETGHNLMIDVIRKTAQQLFIPMTIGGGIKSTDDISRLLNAGADKEEWCCYNQGDKKRTDIKTLDWVQQVEALGAGELLVTSMDYDGMKQGFDHRLLNKIQALVSIPVIASGGDGNAQHFAALFKETDVSAGFAASIFHDEEVSIAEVKECCTENGVDMRNV